MRKSKFIRFHEMGNGPHVQEAMTEEGDLPKRNKCISVFTADNMYTTVWYAQAFEE